MSRFVKTTGYKRLVQLLARRRQEVIERMKKSPSEDFIHQLIGFDMAASEPDFWLKYLDNTDRDYESPTGENE